jgi:MFS family permease
LNKNRQLHYGWIIVLTGAAVLFSCLGLGRFSLGMLLPSMGHSLGMNYSQMGLVGTGNFAGYMLSVILAGIAARAIGARKTIVIGLVLVGGSMILIGQARNFLEVLSLYVATGIGSGLANIPMLGLVSHWFTRSNRGKAAGIILSGNGIAIVFAGLFVPWVNTSSGDEGWRTSWLTIGVISLAVAAVAAIFLRNEPEEKGVMALGQTEPLSESAQQGSGKERERNKWTMVHLGLIYALFGATYAVYATFIVVTLVDERGFGENTAGMFWAVVGALSIFSGPIFGSLSDRLGRKTGMMLVYLMFTICYALVAMDLPNQALYVSIGVFGLTVWSIPTIMSATVGDYKGPAQAVQALGFITLFFGFGQITGPAVAGFIADTTGNFSFAFWLCAALSLLAVLLSYFLRPSAAFVIDPDGHTIEAVRRRMD